jgi:cytoskeletal protein RodZ
VKPATRNGLTVLIVALLGVGVGVVFVRHGRDDRTRVAVAPAVSTTASPTTASPTTASPTTASPTTETTTTVTTAVPTTTAPAATVPPTTEAPAAAAAAAAGAGDPATIQGVTGEHPHTGRRSLLLPALLLIGAGLAGFRVSRRPRPVGSRDNR